MYMQVGSIELDEYRRLGFGKLADYISDMTTDCDVTYASYAEFLNSLAARPGSIARSVVEDFIPCVLRNKEIVQLTAELFAFSYKQQEYVERSPIEFVLYVQEELRKRINPATP
jgi:hypothetical protein